MGDILLLLLSLKVLNGDTSREGRVPVAFVVVNADEEGGIERGEENARGREGDTATAEGSETALGEDDDTPPIIGGGDEGLIGEGAIAIGVCRGFRSGG